jgi:peptidoglycan/xylan/chitin deacetylase (PgdA/CDA1 family)
MHASVAEALSKNPLFEFGNHGYSHSGFSSLSHTLRENGDGPDEGSIEKAEKILQKYPCFKKIFRFPDQEESPERVAMIRALGYTIVKGNIMGADVRVKIPAKIVRRVISSITPGSIIGLHVDDGTHAPKTGTALPVIIEKLRAKGYRFVKVSELLTQKN